MGVSDLELTPSQKTALCALQGQGNLFITGAPGTGKSFVIQEYLKGLPTRPPVLASTGAAAILIGGRTFHSFFGLGIMQGGPERTFQKAIENRRLRTRLRKTACIVIDEISMISFETLDCAERIARAVVGNDSPWGGIRVIAVGDFAQLPPVSKTGEIPWGFLGEAWANSKFHWLELQEVVRSESQEFNQILEKIRWGQLDDEVRSFLSMRELSDIEWEVPRIFPRRYQAESFNRASLERLEGSSRFYETEYRGDGRAVEALMRDAPILPTLELKKGALVMIRMNDPKQRFVNGSVGRVVDLYDEKILIDLKGRLIEIEKFSFTSQDADGNEMASATNFPLSLAYAQTIHKVQGATLDEAHLDLSRLWEPGQAYVALSRVRDPDRLSLASWSEASFRSSSLVADFYSQNRLKRLLSSKTH